MHLALLVPAPWDTVSGGYAYDRRIVAGLRAAGHTVDVVELPGHPLADDTARDAAHTALQTLAPSARPVIDGLALPAFASMEDALQARQAVALIHQPVSLEPGVSEHGQAALHAIEQRLLPRLARIIVTSEATAAHLVDEYAVPRARIAIVPPGTDDAPRATGSNGPGCAILSVGSLIPRKGHDVLLSALARLFDLDWHLTIAGSAERDPVHARSLIARAEELGITHKVTFAGEVSDPALEALWQSADLFALATQWEGYGMAIAEALKRGLPVAATSGGAAASQLTPECSVVCRPGDHEQLSKAMRRMIFDTELRRDMADAAWQVGRTLPAWDTAIRDFAQALA